MSLAGSRATSVAQKEHCKRRENVPILCIAIQEISRK